MNGTATPQQISKYVAIIQQRGTDAPTAQVIQNTIISEDGGPPTGTWTRSSEGVYTLPFAATNKPVISQMGYKNDTPAMVMPIATVGTGIVGYYTIYHNGTNTLTMVCSNAAGVVKDLSEIAGTEAMTLVDVTVYNNEEIIFPD